MHKTLYFKNGRSALDYGLDILKIKKNSTVLLPEIICDVAVKVFINKNFKIKFYKLDSNFNPIWSELNKIKNKNLSAILMLHFFGYPQNFAKFLNFTKKKKIYLIEDNCHSLSVKYKNKRLGKIGHIAIDSPRKILDDLYSGGRLHINVNKKYLKQNFESYRPSYNEILKKNIKRKFIYLFKFLKFSGKRPRFESPYCFSDQDNDFSIKKIDKKSLKIIKKTKLIEEIKKRKKLFLKLNKFSNINNIKPIFKNYNNIVPMHFVGKTKSKKHTKKLLDWGWKNQIDILTWPSFYSKFKLNKKLLNRWEKYICISLNQDITKINETRI